MSRDKDFTPTGLKIEGAWENDRNSENSPLYKAIIRHVFGVEDVICGHHLIYVSRYVNPQDGFTYEQVQEIPSADTLIFDHNVARKCWPDDWEANLTTLALTPPDKRDAVLEILWHGRSV